MAIHTWPLFCILTIFKDQLNSLQQKVIDLETKAENQKYVRRGQNKAFEDIKSIQQEDCATQIKAQNEHNLITLGKILEQEKFEIIELGFRLNQEGKISLKKYYEGKGEDTLFESKGYQIKYDTIRKTKLYQQLKFGLGR